MACHCSNDDPPCQKSLMPWTTLLHAGPGVSALPQADKRSPSGSLILFASDPKLTHFFSLPAAYLAPASISRLPFQVTSSPCLLFKLSCRIPTEVGSFDFEIAVCLNWHCEALAWPCQIRCLAFGFCQSVRNIMQYHSQLKTRKSNELCMEPLDQVIQSW